jgi:hypothetical protein
LLYKGCNFCFRQYFFSFFIYLCRKVCSFSLDHTFRIIFRFLRIPTNLSLFYFSFFLPFFLFTPCFPVTVPLLRCWYQDLRPFSFSRCQDATPIKYKSRNGANIEFISHSLFQCKTAHKKTESELRSTVFFSSL